MTLLLVINPGSTSTKIAVYDGKELIDSENLYHSKEELAPFADISDQYLFRKQTIVKWLQAKAISLSSLAAVVARGGLLHPIPSGVYQVNEAMVEDLKSGRYGKHASNLAGLIAAELSEESQIPAFVVDPVVVDELEPLARISGCPKIERKSIFHALNQKAQARNAASTLGKKYEEMNLIVVHLGGGISIGAHSLGKVIDVNNALDGEGPFSPERAGTLPATKVIDYCFQNDLDHKDLYKGLVGQGGLVAHLKTNDGRVVEKRVEAGDEEAEFFYRAMAYQISKEVGRAAAVLQGRIDGIVLTGGLAYSPLLTGWITDYVAYLGQVLILPGENEMEALALGALRVLNGQEAVQHYASGR